MIAHFVLPRARSDDEGSESSSIVTPQESMYVIPTRRIRVSIVLTYRAQFDLLKVETTLKARYQESLITFLRNSIPNKPSTYNTDRVMVRYRPARLSCLYSWCYEAHRYVHSLQHRRQLTVKDLYFTYRDLRQPRFSSLATFKFCAYLLHATER
jgi:hypothetical protein